MSGEELFSECKGVTYVTVGGSGIHPLCLVADSVAMTLFEASRRTWIKSWHEKEIAKTGGAWDRRYLDGLLVARKKFAEEDGKV